jgi:hypothetical protein
MLIQDDASLLILAISVVVDDSPLSRTRAFGSFQISQMINYFLGGKVILY